jgi:hypothetical protein
VRTARTTPSTLNSTRDTRLGSSTCARTSVGVLTAAPSGGPEKETPGMRMVVHAAELPQAPAGDAGGAAGHAPALVADGAPPRLRTRVAGRPATRTRPPITTDAARGSRRTCRSGTMRILRTAPGRPLAWTITRSRRESSLTARRFTAPGRTGTATRFLGDAPSTVSRPNPSSTTSSWLLTKRTRGRRARRTERYTRWRVTSRAGEKVLVSTTAAGALLAVADETRRASAASQGRTSLPARDRRGCPTVCCLGPAGSNEHVGRDTSDSPVPRAHSSNRHASTAV